ncbi:MAG: DNA polymerase III subunit gamma/tau, partial [Clostridia bacterium]|nr:DNA polymerase III subunit gamma/tau [Clostridia bacterium]
MASYRVLYRKYRPMSFNDVWGQPQVTTILRKQIESGKLSHAYLFTGSRGIGKTTCAKILSKAVNCLHPVDGDPCNECEVCRGIDNETINEVVEMDAASNNGVGDVRDLQERLVFRPTQTKYRVYIIDEVHMLSKEAFNALLKTLEEPPEHVLFILATTEVHAIPATILSRCQRLDFRRIPPEDIAGRLSEIAGEEGASVEENAALLIARIADGGMRDAISLLDQCLTRDSHVTEQTVRDAAGLAGQEHILRLSSLIKQRDAAGLLIELDRLYKLSKDMQRLCEELIAHYRSLMIINTVKRPESLILATSEQLDELKNDAAQFDLPQIMYILDTLQASLEKMGRGAQRRTELELSLLRICREEQAAPAQTQIPPDLEQRLRALERAVREGSAAASAQAEKPQPAAIITAQSAIITAQSAITDLSDRAEPFELWSTVMGRLEKDNAPLFAVLSGSKAYTCDESCLIETTDMGANLLRQAA